MGAKAKKKDEQTYQQKKNAVCIVLYDTTGETLSPDARLEFEEAAFNVASQHPNVLLSISDT
jgi:hypothetical protein